MRKNKYILLITLLFELTLIDGYSQGLQFHSNNDLIENRTSYSVFEKKKIEIKDFLEIDFNLSVNSLSSFGSVLHVKNEENNDYFSLIYTNKDDSIGYLKFSINSREIPLSISLSKEKPGKRKWINISFRIDGQKDTIYLNVDNRKYQTYFNSTTTKFSPLVFFGKHNSFIDVPDISIRNLRISSKKTSLSFNFNETNGTQVHDSDGVVWGEVENPIWLINESYFWKQRIQLSMNKVTAINFDSNLQSFIFINSDSIYYYNITDDVFNGNELKQKTPVPLRLGLSFISEEGKEITVYEVNDVEIGKPTIASLNLETYKWKVWSKSQLKKQSHHHIGVFKPEQKEYIIFGGFGNQEYSNDFYSIKKENENWEKLSFKGDTIAPRFFSGETKLSNNEILIFGGVGNPSGQQSAGKIYYTDCYNVNLTNKTVKKLWDTNEIRTNMVTGTNLILSSDSLHFYSIYYPEYLAHTALKLYRFSILNGTFEIVGDSIPMISERIRTNAKLYCNRELNELYCVTQEFELDGTSKIKIYSISSPPVSANSFYLYANEKRNKHLGFILILIFISFFILFLLFVIWKRSIRQKKLKIQKSLIESAEYTTKGQKFQVKNSVYIFGEFKVFDLKGKEISYLFSPKIQQLFLLILLNSLKNGITSREIYSVMWPEKPLEKAKNSKGVVLNQLRKIINDIEGIELQYENKHLIFKTEDVFYCDYFKFYSHINNIKSSNNIPNNVLTDLISILSTGKFLKFVEFDYLDSFKKDFEDEVLSIIPFQLETFFKRQNYLMVIKLCRIISFIDLTNQTAFHYEIVSYSKLNMLDKARKRFNAFSIEYKKEFKDDYNYTFRDLINHISFEYIQKHSIY